MSESDPPENWHLTVKIAKNLTFKKNNPKNFHFFHKNCNWQIFWKKRKILAFKKTVKFFTIFWQSNGNIPEGQDGILADQDATVGTYELAC